MQAQGWHTEAETLFSRAELLLEKFVLLLVLHADGDYPQVQILGKPDELMDETRGVGMLTHGTHE